MNNMINSYLSQLSTLFLVKQILVIIFISICGVTTVTCLRRRLSVMEILLAFPTGLAMYSLIMYVFLVIGITVNTMVITVALILELGIVLLPLVANRKKGIDGNVKCGINVLLSKKSIMAIMITMLCIIVICCLGIIPVSISNDSMYYYHMYPKAIATYGVLRREFNVFLTDVGQCSAIIGTIPFIYGFDEIFGIQAFLNIDVYALFVYGVYEEARRVFDKDSCKAAIYTVLASVLLATSMPYIIMCSWAMSNGYFMNYMFVCAFVAYRFITDDSENLVNIRGNMVILGILFTEMSLLRMEGSIIALILIMCISSLKYTNKQLLFGFIIPISAAALIYDIKIFVLMNIEAPYTFLTKQKAIIQLVGCVCVAVYVGIVRGRMFVKLQRRLKSVICIGLVLVNIALLVYDRVLYISNMKTFVANVSNQSGWGLFPMLIIGIYMLSVIIMDRKALGLSYWDIVFVSYVLTALAVSFAREDLLVENLADSGNRVLLQVTLLAFYAATIRLLGVFGKSQTD